MIQFRKYSVSDRYECIKVMSGPKLALLSVFFIVLSCFVLFDLLFSFNKVITFNIKIRCFT